MGFLKGAAKTANVFVNVRADKWIGVENIKQSLGNTALCAKNLFKIQQAERVETFEEAQQRLSVDEAELTKIKIKYTFFYIFYLIGALILFSYGFYIAYHAHRYIGFLMCFSLTLYGLSRAFFYHFWVYQIQQKKLGLTLKDWLHHYILNPR